MGQSLEIVKRTKRITTLFNILSVFIRCFSKAAKLYMMIIAFFKHVNRTLQGTNYFIKCVAVITLPTV
jgi:hypothetical protein